MPQAVTIRSLPRAFEFVKVMQADGLEWSEGYRDLGREVSQALLPILGRPISPATVSTVAKQLDFMVVLRLVTTEALMLNAGSRDYWMSRPAD